MRVKIYPGTHFEEERRLADVMHPCDIIASGDDPTADAWAKLVELLVEKGVLDLADCIRLGGPYMEDLPC